MPFPAGLTLVSVHGRIDALPSGGASGQACFTRPYALVGGADNSIVPPRPEYATLDATGEFTISLPATNDPDWTPVNWAYSVEIISSSGITRGTLQLSYLTASVELADLIQLDGAAVAGTTYIPLSSRGVALGVAPLDADGDVNDASGAKITGGGGGGTPSGTVVTETGYGQASAAGAAAAYSRGDHSHGTPALGTSGTTAAAGDHTHAAVYQPLDADLTTIAGLTATTDNMIQSVGSAWASRTPAQVKTALAVAIADVASLQAALDAKAPLASPALTGTPTAPTAAGGTNTTQVATTAFVTTAVGGGGGAAPTFARAIVTSGDLTMPSDAGWAVVAGLTLAIPAVIGDDLELQINCMFDMTTGAADFFELVVLVGGSIVRCSSNGTATPSDEGDPALYPSSSVRFRGSHASMSFQAVSGDISGGNVTFGFAHKGTSGAAKIYAGTTFPFRWHARNDH